MQPHEIQAIVAATLAEQRSAAPTDIDEVVRKAIAAVLVSFGIKPADSDEVAADFRHLRKWRKSVEGAQTLTFRVIVGTLVSGFLAAIWMGIKVMLGK